MCVSCPLCLFYLFFICLTVLLPPLLLSPSVRSSQCADVSSPIPMLKALFFSRCGLRCPSSLKTRLFLKREQTALLSLSLSFFLSFFLPLSLPYSVESRTGGSVLECITSPLPSPPSRRLLRPDHQPLG